MLRGFFGSLIFAIIARILCGNHLNFLLIYTIFNVEETIQNVDVVKRNDFLFTYLKKSHMDSNIPTNPAYGVVISQLVILEFALPKLTSWIDSVDFHYVSDNKAL